MTENDGIYNYKLIDNDHYMVGDNNTVNGNGAVAGTKFVGTISIPEHFKNIPITEIGQYSFAHCREVTEIFIGRNVYIIHFCAFTDMVSAKFVFIPSSVEMIMDTAINFFNTSQSHYSPGKAEIVFEAGSKLKYISYNFNYINEIQFFSPSILTPQCHGKISSHVNKLYLYSPYSFHFCNLWFQSYITNYYIYHFISRKVLFIILFLNI